MLAVDAKGAILDSKHTIFSHLLETNRIGWRFDQIYCGRSNLRDII